MSRFIVRVQSPSGTARDVIVLASSESRACAEACKTAAVAFADVADRGWLPLYALEA